jgi:MazG family protein
VSDRLQKLQSLVAALRAPDGCPWDREQRLENLRAYLLEEAHEVAAAIDHGDWRELEEELGDLIFQIVFIAELAAEQRGFDLDGVLVRVEKKMVDRHPHVFGGPRLPDPQAVRRAWEERKVEQREESALAELPPSLPALVAAYRMTQKAAALGFDWHDARDVLDKVLEETEELRRELATETGSRRRRQEELGDLLFTVANLARHLEIDPEAALAAANRKFRNRFQAIEGRLRRRGLKTTEVDDAELERLWEEAKGDSSRSG